MVRNLRRDSGRRTEEEFLKLPLDLEIDSAGFQDIDRAHIPGLYGGRETNMPRELVFLDGLPVPARHQIVSYLLKEQIPVLKARFGSKARVPRPSPLSLKLKCGSVWHEGLARFAAPRGRCLHRGDSDSAWDSDCANVYGVLRAESSALRRSALRIDDRLHALSLGLSCDHDAAFSFVMAQDGGLDGSVDPMAVRRNPSEEFRLQVLWVQRQRKEGDRLMFGRQGVAICMLLVGCWRPGRNRQAGSIED